MIGVETKPCKKCRLDKPLDDYSMMQNGRGGRYRRNVCDACINGGRREDLTSKDRANAIKREKYRDPVHRARMLENQYRSKYGISWADRDAMLAAQNGCDACGTWEPGTKGWATDHDHSCCAGSKTCGECLRGIVCTSCNLALGHSGDSIERLSNLIDYLRRYQPTTKRNQNG